MDKKESRLRRSVPTRKKIAELQMPRLQVHRTNVHIYASVFAADGQSVVASASTVELEVRNELAGKTGRGGNKSAAELVGKRIAEKANKAGIESVAFDRSGFRYHGRIKALAEAARAAGLKF